MRSKIKSMQFSLHIHDIITVIWTITSASITNALPAYQLKIPNGFRVPHPCFPDKVTYWPGVGHWRAEGSGEMNTFGQDFYKNKFQWTTELCQKDSDGDGKTNGEELGDPNCMWRYHIQAPPATDSTSHPGICEPVDSPQCLEKNNYLSCGSATTFSLTGMRGTAPAGLGSCPAILSQDLRRHEMRLSGSTTITGSRDGSAPHACQKFTLPSDQTYHLVAAEPIIDMERLQKGVSLGITHIVVQACIDQRDMSKLALYDLNTPKSTCTLLSPCKQLVAVWKFDRVTQPNICMPEFVGIRFGLGRFSTIVVDLYYNYTNAWKGVNVESTGLAIFYTSNLRRYDAGLMLLSEKIIEIPPNSIQSAVTTRLTSKCTEKILEKDKISLFYAAIHTKKASQRVQLYVQTSDGSSEVGIIDLQKERAKTTELFAEKINSLPVSATNEIVVKCYYNTEKKSSYTFFGEGVDDEMCAASLLFYPASNKTWFYDLTQNGVLSECDRAELQQNCPYIYFTKQYARTIRDIKERCHSSDFPPTTCLDTCKSLLIDKDLVGHSCLNVSVFNKIARNIYHPPYTPLETASVLASIQRCKMEIYTVALQHAGLFTQLNKTLAEKFGYNMTGKRCDAAFHRISFINLFILIMGKKLFHELIFSQN